MRTAMAFVAVAVVVVSAGCSDDEPLADERTPSPETTTTTAVAGDTTSSTSVAEPATTVETTTTTATEESTTTAETTTTTTTLTAEPWTRPPLDGEWVEVAAGAPWGPVFVSEIDALPGGGYVAVTPASPFAETAEQEGFPISTVMWSPDGVEWFDGDPEREIGRPFFSYRSPPPQLAVASDQVVVIDGTDFSDHVSLAIGDPRTASWDVVALDYTALDASSHREFPRRVEMVSLAASDDVVLVAAYAAHEALAETMEVVTWVVDPTTGTSETNSFTVVNQDEDDTGAPLVAWVDGRWILFAIEDPPGPERDERRHTLWTSSDGLAWSQADLPSGLGVYFDDGLVNSLAVGPMGVVAVTCPLAMGNPPAAVWYSADGLEWAKVSQSHPCHSLTAVGDYGFVIDLDGSALQLVAADGSEVYQMPVPGPFEDTGEAAASSGDTLLVSTGAVFRGFWLYSPP